MVQSVILYAVINMNFSDRGQEWITNLKKIRTHKGFSQEELSLELAKHGCFIKRSTYSKYETDDRNLPCDVLIKLSLVYELSADFILGLKKE